MGSVGRIRKGIVSVAVLAVLLVGARLALADSGVYQVRKLVSDQPGVAEQTDPNLVNAWGIAFTQFSPNWVADNGTGVSTIYDGNGVAASLVVTIPGGNPTGAVANNSTTDFIVSSGGKSGAARFLFATENGIIAGWNPTVDATHAIVVVDHSASGAVYKGLTIGADGTRQLLYATDFHNNRVDVFDKSFNPVTHPGAFVDTNVPDTYGPFGIQNLLGAIYVTYAKADKDRHDDVPGGGNGIVDVFGANGSLIQRVYKGGRLNSPWGIALAPADFGVFAGKLIVGNFGDGTLNVFDPASNKILGTLSDANRDPIVIPGLWAITFGNGAQNQPTNVLFFASGPDDESHGLYGRISFVQ
jgi:uncharacterized protein (TIGR03118 family)